MRSPSSLSTVWTPAAMMQVKAITDVQPSPDGSLVIYSATEADFVSTPSRYLSKIYLARAANADRDSTVLFSQPECSSWNPRWSPDGQWVGFLSDRAGKKNLYVIPAAGGEARSLTDGPRDVINFKWAPDSKRIAFLMEDETAEYGQRPFKSAAYEYKKDLLVNRLFVVTNEPEGAAPYPLTQDRFYVRGAGDFGTIGEEYDWSPDGKTIAFAFTTGSGFDSHHSQGTIATIDVATKHIRVLPKLAPLESLPRFSADGKRIACMISDDPVTYGTTRFLAVRDEDGGDSRVLASTPNAGPAFTGPSFLGWAYDGKHLVFCEPKRTKYQLVLIPVDGQSPKVIPTGDHFFSQPALSGDRRTLGCVVQSPNTPPEVHVTTITEFKPVPVSRLNHELLELTRTQTELVDWASSDGTFIEGLLTYPSNYNPENKYPLLLVIHGGPMGFFDETFLGTPYPYPLAAFADRGFFVLRVNPRGSTGYGHDFRYANYEDWGGMDFQDLMSGVRSLEKEGLIDAHRMGVMGWSYGGYMTARVITETHRFRAASMGAGISNLLSMAGTTDLHSFARDYFRKDFWKHRELYIERSPIFHVDNVRTPCLIQHGLADVRVPPSQALEFFHALTAEQHEAKLTFYPGMGHRFSDPQMQLELMEENLRWFVNELKSEGPK